MIHKQNPGFWENGKQAQFVQVEKSIFGLSEFVCANAGCTGTWPTTNKQHSHLGTERTGSLSDGL